jgi:osmotically-inducible protein OsmY
MSQIVTTALALEDEELARRVRNSLVAHLSELAETLEVAADQGVVTLRGEVPSPSAKWRIAQCGHRVAGVVRLVDELEVARVQRGPARRVDRISPPWIVSYRLNPSSPRKH